MTYFDQTLHLRCSFDRVNSQIFFNETMNIGGEGGIAENNGERSRG